MASGVLFIIGAGPRIGRAVAKKFLKEGYAVAVGSRNPQAKDWADNEVPLVTVDVTNLESIYDAFLLVRNNIGPPNVIVYNRK
jgi:NAD(P)-dependent dehydrogenase (short-subunit alcohol dehydrogenase family)